MTFTHTTRLHPSVGASFTINIEGAYVDFLTYPGSGEASIRFLPPSFGPDRRPGRHSECDSARRDLFCSRLEAKRTGTAVSTTIVWITCCANGTIHGLPLIC